MTLHAQTPPGKYDFQLTVGAKTLDAIAQVTEVVDLRLDPSEITILAGADTSYTRTFVAENAGNVPLPTGAQCEAPLFDSFDLISAMLAGLHSGDRKSAASMATLRHYLYGYGTLGINVSGKSEMFLHGPAKDRQFSARTPEPCDCGDERESKRQPEFTR